MGVPPVRSALGLSGPVLTDWFRVMGTAAEVQVVDGDPALLGLARERLDGLEAQWSRFRPDSEVSGLNQSAGSPVRVGSDTLLLVQRSLAAARATDGRFDPTIGGALTAYGYDRTFEQVRDHAVVVEPVPVVDGSWPAIEIDVEAGTVCLPEGSTFDPGGIGKGLAADLVATELAPHVGGILVNVGGDLRACGRAADPAGWIVSIENPHDPDQELGRFAIPEGGVATSSRLRRSWDTASGPAHHLIDPRTGRPAETDVVAVTVVAAEAWWGEAQATSLFLLGPAGLAGIDASAEAVFVMADGSWCASPMLQPVLP